MGHARGAVTAALLLCASGCGDSAADPLPRGRGVSGAYLVLPAAPERPGVLYFIIRADDRYFTASDVQRLKKVAVTGAERAEIHQSMTMDGMTSMRPLGEVPLRNGINRFCPGGLHVMLFGISPALRFGSKADVRLTFAGGKPVTAQAAVVPFGQRPPRDPPLDCATKIDG